MQPKIHGVAHRNMDGFVIATGVQYSVRQFIEKTAAALGMQLRWEGAGVNEVGYWTNRPDSSLRAQQTPSLQAQQTSSLRAQRGNPGSMDRHGLQPRDDQEVPIVKIDPRYFRPTEVASLLGDPSKAKQKIRLGARNHAG